MNVRKASVVLLLDEGYRLIRPRDYALAIFSCSSFGAWKAFYRLEQAESMESAMLRHLEDPTTIQL